MRDDRYLKPFAGGLADRPCQCGAHPPANVNASCERCRLVYTVALAAATRDAQRRYFESRRGSDLERSMNLESALDETLKRATSRGWQPTLIDDDAEGQT